MVQHIEHEQADTGQRVWSAGVERACTRAGAGRRSGGGGSCPEGVSERMQRGAGACVRAGGSLLQRGQRADARGATGESTCPPARPDLRAEECARDARAMRRGPFPDRPGGGQRHRSAADARPLRGSQSPRACEAPAGKLLQSLAICMHRAHTVIYARLGASQLLPSLMPWTRLRRKRGA